MAVRIMLPSKARVGDTIHFAFPKAPGKVVTALKSRSMARRWQSLKYWRAGHNRKKQPFSFTESLNLAPTSSRSRPLARKEKEENPG